MGNAISKKITKDFSLNIIAVFFSTGVMQLVVYPCLAKELSDVEYGAMLTLMGYESVVTLALGASLCNARLILDAKYKEKGYKGDFPLLVIIMGLIAAAIMSVCCTYLRIKYSIILGIAITAFLTVLKSYYLVEYRLNVDYYKNLVANIFTGIGFVIGAFVVIRYLDWPWVFSLGCVLGIIYVDCTTFIVREPINRTPLFAQTVKVVMIMASGGFINNITTYLDRFIIYPVLGGEYVSIYATAAFFSKGIFLLLAPISSVFLSYLTTNRIVLTLTYYLKLNCAMILIGIGFYFLSISFGKYVTRMLFPSLVEDAIVYLPYVSFGIILSVIESFSAIVVLVKGAIRWQTLLPILRVVFYFVLCYSLTVNYCLMGTAIAVICTNVIMFLITFSIGYFSIKNN